MELRHLRYFTAVAEELHFGRAAKRLRMAQPPLSQQIRALEIELGLKLFHRTSRRVDLTPEGRTFLERARVVLLHAERAVDFGRTASRGEAGRIAIGFVTSAVYNLVPAILREFHQRRPQVEIRCFEMDPDEQLAAFRQHKLDIGFLRSAVTESGFSTMELSRESLWLAVPAEVARRHPSPTRLSELSEMQFIMLPRTVAPLYYDLVVTACQRAGFTPRFSHEAGEWQTALALVAAGLGVMLVPESLRHWRRPGVTYTQFRPKSGSLTLELVWRNAEQQPLVDAFVATAKAVAESTPSGAIA